MATKRILYIVNSLGQGSGVMSFIMNLYRNIDREKVQIDFLVGTHKEQSYEKEILELGGKIYNLPVPKKISFKNYIDFKNRINLFFKESNYKYDIIHSHVPIFNIFYFPIAKKYDVKHLITHSHSIQSSSSFLGKIRNFFLLINSNKLANIYFACTEQAAIFLFGKNKVENGKVNIVKNAIDSQKFKYSEEERQRIRKELEIEGKFVIGHVGRFSKEKNHIFLIDIFYETLKLHDESILLLAGDGDLMPYIKDKVLELGISEKVKFLGIRNDINKIMQAMDTFILPSTFEGLGIVVIEAQSTGLPCFVSTNVPEDVSITELITHLSLEKSPKYWAEKIVKKGNLNKERANYSEKIKNANYDISDNAKWIEKFYLRLK